ncbi:MAG: porin [Thiobacillus sp.]|nr:porin [Thiobacillus sp.]
MKKSLIALAIAGAVSAPAFAATSNVDVYGVMNIGVFSVDSDVTGEDRSTSVTSQSSRIGFKGAEDLGGGLSAIWQIETGVNVDEGGGFGGRRNTFVGLKGGFGTVLMGKHDTPMKMLGRKVDNFGDTFADSRNLLGTNADTGTSMFDLRTDNTIAYISPNFSGLTFIGAYVTDHNQTPDGANCAVGLDCNDTDAYSVSADYTNGPLMVGLGYERHNVVDVLAVPENDLSRSMWRLVAGYSFGNFKLGGQYERGSGDTGLDEADRNAWGLFGNYAMGNIVLKANYLSVGEYKGVDDSGANQYTLGVDYNMSKRTTVYALYAQVKNDNNAFFDLGRAQGLGDTTTTAAGGEDPSVFGVGVKHTF